MCIECIILQSVRRPRWLRFVYYLMMIHHLLVVLVLLICELIHSTVDLLIHLTCSSNRKELRLLKNENINWLWILLTNGRNTSSKMTSIPWKSFYKSNKPSLTILRWMIVQPRIEYNYILVDWLSFLYWAYLVHRINRQIIAIMQLWMLIKLIIPYSCHYIVAWCSIASLSADKIAILSLMHGYWRSYRLI